MLDGQLTLFDSTEEYPSSISMEEDGTGEKNERAVISRQGQHRSRENWKNLPVLEKVVHEPEKHRPGTLSQNWGRNYVCSGTQVGQTITCRHVRPKYGLINPAEI